MSTFTTIASVTGANGIYPVGSLIADANGNLFGATLGGGSNSAGTVFEIPLTASGYGPVTTLASFDNSNGASPEAGLVADGAGDLFGTTLRGGANDFGTVFEIPKTASGYGPVTVLASLSIAAGFSTTAGLIIDANGDLFGTTPAAASSAGTVFEIPKTASGYGPLTTVWAFNNVTSDGGSPLAGLLADANGDLFGTTSRGGPGNAGTVFEIPMTASGYGPLTTLASFSQSNGFASDPQASLISDAAGDLFGTTSLGGSGNSGTVFEIPKTASGYGPLTTLVDFGNGAGGVGPINSLILDANGNLYGTAQGGGSLGFGTVFEIPKTASGYGAETVLYNFTGGGDGAYPTAGLVIDAAGNLLGTTAAGSGGLGGGTVFEITGSGPVPTPVVTIALAHPGPGGDFTNNPTLTGTADPNAVVSFRGLPYGPAINATVTADASGHWTFTPTLSDGSYVIEASEANGDHGVGAAEVSFTLATAAPTVKATESISGLTNQTSDIITVTAKPAKSDKIYGDAIAGVEIYDRGKDLGAATFASGVWTYTASNLADGAHNFSAVATDLAGNSRTVTLAPVKVDTTPPTSTIWESVTLAGASISATVNGIAKDKVAGVASVAVNGQAASLGAGGAWSYTDASLAAGANAFQALVTDKAGNAATVAGGTVTVNGATSIALAGGSHDQIVIASAAGGNSINVTGEASDRFVYGQTLGHYDSITGFIGGAGKTHDVIDVSAIAGATTYQGGLTQGGALNADSVGWLYDALHNETAIYVNNTGAAESLTGASAAAPMLELAGHVGLVGSNFALAKA